MKLISNQHILDLYHKNLKAKGWISTPDTIIKDLKRTTPEWIYSRLLTDDSLIQMLKAAFSLESKNNYLSIYGRYQDARFSQDEFCRILHYFGVDITIHTSFYIEVNSNQFHWSLSETDLLYRKARGRRFADIFVHCVPTPQIHELITCNKLRKGDV